MFYTLAQLTMDFDLLKLGTYPFAMECVCGLKATNQMDKKAGLRRGSIILADWGRGQVNVVNEAIYRTTFRSASATKYSNTTIICRQQISTGKFRVTVDDEGHVNSFKLIGELKYNDPRICTHSTSGRNFTAQLATLLRDAAGLKWDMGIMHNDNRSHTFAQFIGEYLINKTLSDPLTPLRSFEDAQHALSMFNKGFFTIVLAQNRNRVFGPSGNVRRSEVGQLESIQPRWSIDPVMFYITMAILGFQLISGTIIFRSTSTCFLSKFPYNLSSEISFFHASSALSDLSGTANMSSAMRSRHLKRLGGTYGYGSFRGLDGERHVRIERMSLISGYEEAVVAASTSSTIPETTVMVRTVEAVPSASSSPPHGGGGLRGGPVSAAGNLVVPVLAVDQIGTQAVSAGESGTWVGVVTSPVSGSAVPVVETAGEDAIVLVV